MKAKEKAKELFDKYVELSGIFVGDYESEKEMCLIAVDEILKYIGEDDFIYPSPQFGYWQEVKQEILKL